MNQLPPYTISPLGDCALIIDFGNEINNDLNKVVHSIFYQLKKLSHPGITDVIPSYSSITICYDVILIKLNSETTITVFDIIRGIVEKVLQEPIVLTDNPGQLVKIPVCFDKEFAPDINEIEKVRNISVNDIIDLFTNREYRVYMLGFLPGFAYMGEVNEKITMPRKKQPVTVEAGSVGIAGKQTGIYPLQSPGGWQIIGKTPLKLFDTNRTKPALLNPGDSIQFYSINKDEFEDIKSRNA